METYNKNRKQKQSEQAFYKSHSNSKRKKVPAWQRRQEEDDEFEQYSGRRVR